MGPSAEKEAEAVQELLREVMEDRSVPKNIRRAVEEALAQMGAKLETVSISNAMYALDDVSNDINIPSHTRTSIWEILQRLEGLKERIKG